MLLYSGNLFRNAGLSIGQQSAPMHHYHCLSENEHTLKRLQSMDNHTIVCARMLQWTVKLNQGKCLREYRLYCRYCTCIWMDVWTNEHGLCHKSPSNLWLLCTTQTLIHAQWWSIFITHLFRVVQHCKRLFIRILGVPLCTMFRNTSGMYHAVCPIPCVLPVPFYR